MIMKLIIKICHNKITSRIGPPIKRKKNVSQVNPPLPPTASFCFVEGHVDKAGPVEKDLSAGANLLPRDAEEREHVPREQEQSWTGGREG